ncbi:chemotaxis protein CheW [Halalkalibacillus sediminis]|uniref:Chemotaxis protein CheW n=1 Tax=Halalkalibacillus sediminis TaxID=2018042 RepID=A0A2I0QTJ7_9BACI|nr:chemotaxis protein CheW [Halalkalibacillus sediminis]PKR77675.1 chemotaxis protein CheW [Halalkalibacillus sediminis]
MENVSKYVLFQLDDERLGVNINQIHSIERVPGLTKMPEAPEFVKGIVELRGEITTIVDFKQMIQGVDTDLTQETRILICQLDGLKIGLLVEAAKEVVDIPADQLEEPPKMVGGLKKEYINGVAKLNDRLIILVDLDRIFSKEEVEEIHAVQ